MSHHLLHCWLILMEIYSILMICNTSESSCVFFSHLPRHVIIAKLPFISTFLNNQTLPLVGIKEMDPSLRVIMLCRDNGMVNLIGDVRLFHFPVCSILHCYHPPFTSAAYCTIRQTLTFSCWLSSRHLSYQMSNSFICPSIFVHPFWRKQKKK